MMRENIANYKTWLVEFLRSGRPWACSHCGQLRELPEDGWWSADLLREALRLSGPSAMVAINELVNEGALLMDERLRLRLAS